MPDILFSTPGIAILDAAENPLERDNHTFLSRFSPEPLGSTGELSLVVALGIYPKVNLQVKYALKLIGGAGDYALELGSFAGQQQVSDLQPVSIPFTLRNLRPISVANHAKLELTVTAQPPYQGTAQLRFFLKGSAGLEGLKKMKLSFKEMVWSTPDLQLKLSDEKEL